MLAKLVFLYFWKTKIVMVSCQFFYHLYRQHPSSCPVGTLHPGPLYWRNRPWRAPQSLHHPCPLYTSQDAVFCKAFPTTLKGPTLEWFTTLPPYSIDSFNVLSHMFSTHFAGSRPHQLPLSTSWALDRNKANHLERS